MRQNPDPGSILDLGFSLTDVRIFQDANAIYENVNSTDLYFLSFPSNNFVATSQLMATCYLFHQIISFIKSSRSGYEVIGNATNFDVPGKRKIKQYSKPTKFSEHFLCSL